MRIFQGISVLQLVIFIVFISIPTAISSSAQKLDRASTKNQDITFHPSDDPAEEAARAPIGSPEKEEESNEVLNPLPNLRIFGNMRHRSEVNARFATPGEDVPRFHLLRTRLNVSFDPVNDVTAFVQIQDSRVFGGQNPSLGRGTLDGSADALDFHQAYFKVARIFNTPIELRVGRQILAYGNLRYIGHANWNNIGRTFDAAVLSYKDKHRRIDLISSKLVSTTGGMESQNMHGFYGTFDYLWTHHSDFFFLFDNDTESVSRGVDAGKSKLVRYTAGSLLYGSEGSFVYELEMAAQRGQMAQTDSTARGSLNGYLLSAEVGLMNASPSKLKVSVLYSWLSGDNTPGDNTFSNFTQLFPAGYKFAGYMNYFPAAYPANGLHNMAVRFSGKVSDQLTLKLDAHHFTLDKSVFLNEKNKTWLGQEFDLTVAYKYNKHFTVASGSSFFMAQPLMEEVIGDTSAFWFYITTLVSF